jgi:hypothetical protein
MPKHYNDRVTKMFDQRHTTKGTMAKLKKGMSDHEKKHMQGAYFDDHHIVHAKTGKTMSKVVDHEKDRSKTYGEVRKEIQAHIAKHHPESRNESVEQIDEISKDLAGRYIKKAQISTADAGRDTMDSRKKIRDRGIHKIVNRRMGTADAVRKLTGKARVPATESAIPTVYSRILEERAKHYKSATKPEDWNEKEKNNKGAMDMKKDMAVDTSDKISNYDELGHDDASKAGRVTKAAKGRPGDNAAGDKNVINPVKK